MNILVYCDQGVSHFSFYQIVVSLQNFFSSQFGKKYQEQKKDGGRPSSVISIQEDSVESFAPLSLKIIPVSHRFFLCENWETDAVLVVVPGGRDVFYHEKLKGEGNLRIKEFVREGGSYLGICAGAYYGATSIEFEKGYPLEICAERELGFFPGSAIGPAFGQNQFCYQSEQGALAATVEWWEDSSTLDVYYNGGCYFHLAQSYSEVKVLARYSAIPSKPAAIVECSYGKGKAFLSGVHLEFSACSLSPFDPWVKKIKKSLEKSDKSRALLWKKILLSAVYNNIYQNLIFN